MWEQALSSPPIAKDALPRTASLTSEGSRSSLSAVVQKPAGALRRMRTQRLFIGLGAPAGPVRNDEMAVLIVGQAGEQLGVPCPPADIGFHDPQIMHRRAEEGVPHGAPMADD